MILDLKYIHEKYKIQSKGVLHIGAHLGQEAGTYNQLGMKKMIFIEANPSIYAQLLTNIKQYPSATAVNACISDAEKEVDFNISSNEGQSSSILPLGTHKTLHPDVSYTGKIKAKTVRMESILKDMNLEGVDFLNIDIQGMELPALKSMGAYLHNFNYAYLEVNREQVYEGCAEIDEIDAYLLQFNFVRKETNWVNGWGDAFYVKEAREVLPNTFSDPLSIVAPAQAKPVLKEEGMIVQIEETFLGVSENFEAWFAENVKSSEILNRMYIPIQWSNFYSKNEWGRDTTALGHVQYVLDKLDPSKKYFTICEWHEGVINYFKGKDIIVFGPGEVNIDHKIDIYKDKIELKKFILQTIQK